MSGKFLFLLPVGLHFISPQQQKSFTVDDLEYRWPKLQLLIEYHVL